MDETSGHSRPVPNASSPGGAFRRQELEALLNASQVLASSLDLTQSLQAIAAPRPPGTVETVASRAAGIIESSSLIEKTRQRAMRSDALRRVASMAASTATLDEIFKFTINELALLLKCDAAALFLQDEKAGELRLHPRSVFGVTAEASSPIARLHSGGTPFHATVTGSGRALLSGRLSAEHTFSQTYLPLFSRLQLESVVIVPIAAGDKAFGEMVLGSRKAQYFSAFDLETAVNASEHLAGAIEDSTRTTQTDEGLRGRADQLTALSRVSRELNSSRDLQSLLEIIRDESLRITRAECGTILLFDASASSDPPPVSLSVGCSLPDTFPIIERTAIQTGEAQLVADYTENGRVPIHDGVVSALIVPILSGGTSVGLMHLHSSQPSFFDPSSHDIAQTLASQAAVAIGNVRQFQEQRQRNELLRRRAETLARLTEVTDDLKYELLNREALDINWPYAPRWSTIVRRSQA